MRIRSLCRWLCLFVAFALPSPARCDEAMPTLPFDTWLKEPDRRDLEVHFDVEKPKLTYQQRIYVEIRVELDGKKLQTASVKRDLHFLLRLADENGNWVDGYSYTHTVIDKPMARRQAVQWIAEVYVKPGAYVAHALVYDAVRNQRSSFHKIIVAAAAHNDPLPDLANGIQTAEFFVSDQRAEVPLAQSHANIPIASTSPVRIDVIVNFTPSSEFAGRGGVYRRTGSVMLQLASILSDLQPSQGCVYLSGLDVQGQQVLLDRIPAESLNRDLMTDKVLHVDPHRVSVSSLESRKQQSKFFNDFVTRVVGERNGCANGKPQHRVLIVAAGGMLYPEGTQIRKLEENACACRIYYLHPSVVWDELVKTIAPMHPRRFTFDDPGKLRKVLARLKRDIEEYVR